MSSDYDDIIHLPHHVSKRHPRMPMHKRAAQFAPFSAITGHAEAIKEAARVTEIEPIMSEDSNATLNKKMTTLMRKIGQRPIVRIHYFCPDKRKEGGCYLQAVGILKKMNYDERYIEIVTQSDQMAIPWRWIVDIQEEETKL